MARLQPFAGMQHLDVAGGTGDVAFRVLRGMADDDDAAAGAPDAAGAQPAQESAAGGVTVCDINPAMLEEGRRRAAAEQHGARQAKTECGCAAAQVRQPDSSTGAAESPVLARQTAPAMSPGRCSCTAAHSGCPLGRKRRSGTKLRMLFGTRAAWAARAARPRGSARTHRGWPAACAAARLRWVVGDAERLPLAARSADGYTIAFGIRNVTRIDAALAEAFRVRVWPEPQATPPTGLTPCARARGLAMQSSDGVRRALRGACFELRRSRA